MLAANARRGGLGMTTFGGSWTQEKLRILDGYLGAYTTALKDQPFQLIYVDAFAGEGFWRPGSEYATDDYGEFGDLLKGSATMALEVQDKPFDRLVFIEKDPERCKSLQALSAQHPGRDIQVITDDANLALPAFCNRMGNFERAVVFLDPYAANVAWDTVEAIARTMKIDCWILFPLMAINRMMPTANEPPPQWANRLDTVFGGREHWQNLYQPSAQLTMFDDTPRLERGSGGNRIPELYRDRLRSVFHRVAPTQRALRNSKNAPIFELFFAAGNPVGAPIAVGIADHLLSHL